MIGSILEEELDKKVEESRGKSKKKSTGLQDLVNPKCSDIIIGLSKGLQDSKEYKGIIINWMKKNHMPGAAIDTWDTYNEKCKESYDIISRYAFLFDLEMDCSENMGPTDDKENYRGALDAAMDHEVELTSEVVEGISFAREAGCTLSELCMIKLLKIQKFKLYSIKSRLEYFKGE
tara:strand:- start:5523 stop:6050 length:528 start_codon:yes stop_codon:yes gene_type:complete